MAADATNEIDDYAEPRFLLARALVGAGGDRKRARALATQAREGYVKGEDPKGTKAVDTWLARNH